MNKRLLAFGVPLLTTIIIVGSAWVFHFQDVIRASILVGMTVALVQSWVSMGSLIWAWKKSFFYVVWGAGIFLRLLVFGFMTYLVLHKHHLYAPAVLISLVLGTSLFLAVESILLFPLKK